mmetsp:Transcript_57669/g.137354  ORF Transcript_57669/g.137354 Transcript_57669/m.137354 type:complete len:402 (+) Transcript_57669:1360-2565(+)
MEKAEREERGLKLPRLQAGVDVLLGEFGVGASQVGLQVRRRLIGHLDAPLQDGLRDEVPELALHQSRRLRGQEASEVLMGELFDDLQRALQVFQPGLHQVNVLQHDPSTFLCHLVQAVQGDLLLALAHGDVQQLPVRLCLAQLSSQGLDGGRGVHTWEQHEEEGGDGRGLFEGDLHVEGRLLHKVLAQVVDHELRQRGADAVLAHDAEQEEALELRQVPRRARQVRILRLLLAVPPLPAQGVLLDVLRELTALLEGLHVLQGLQLGPLGLGEPAPGVLRHRRGVGIRRAADQRVALLAGDLARASQDVHAHHAHHGQLVRVQQTSPRVVPHEEGDDVAQQIHAQLEILTGQLDDLFLLFLLWRGLLSLRLLVPIFHLLVVASLALGRLFRLRLLLDLLRLA